MDFQFETSPALMSKLLPTITINTDVDINNATNKLPTPNVRQTPNKKKRKIAKFPLSRQLNVKNASDSGGSSADERGKLFFS